MVQQFGNAKGEKGKKGKKKGKKGKLAKRQRGKKARGERRKAKGESRKAKGEGKGKGNTTAKIVSLRNKRTGRIHRHREQRAWAKGGTPGKADGQDENHKERTDRTKESVGQ